VRLHYCFQWPGEQRVPRVGRSAGATQGAPGALVPAERPHGPHFFVGPWKQHGKVVQRAVNRAFVEGFERWREHAVEEMKAKTLKEEEEER